MATQWRGEIVQVALREAGARSRAYVVNLMFKLYDTADPNTVLAHVAGQIPYPASAFRGLTRPQALQLIRDTGVGEIPPLRDVGDWLVTDFDDGEVIRALPANYEFGP